MQPPRIDNPILNSPFAEPTSHWLLDDNGIPTGIATQGRRRSEFIVPVPPPKHTLKAQPELGLEDEYGQRQSNDYINTVREKVSNWRALGEAGLRASVTPVTAAAAALARPGPRAAAVLLPDRGGGDGDLARGGGAEGRA